MSIGRRATLRLNMPQWQGGNRHEYYFGSTLLAWLAPPAVGPVETVPVPEPEPGETLEIENGILGRAALLRQARAAREAIERHRPDRIVTLGGDCLIDLAPIAYLNGRYGGNLGVLWVDAHPDVLTPKDFAQGNAQVLGALLGRGDPELAAEVDAPVKASHVMYAGLDAWTPAEGEVITGLGLRCAGAAMLAETSFPVLDWIADEGIVHLAVHFDVDVLDPTTFGPVLFNEPGAPADALAGVPRGRMAPGQVVRLLQDVAGACDVVGLAIAEYMPWEAIATRDLLRRLPLLTG
ncbi:MAG TPA: arginase family protein [Geminicoccaceae bacterium]|nr:arginase family protein [Geminicoccus sp.]HMU52071.1 arginase family protein [Geminicoccaceae bacterium]